MKYVACDAVIDHSRIPQEGVQADPSTLIDEMDQLEIDCAIVRSEMARSTGPVPANGALMDRVGAFERLMPAWFVTPDGVEPEFDPSRVIESMIWQGVRVCWLDPRFEKMSLLPWCSGSLYEILQDRRIPLLLEYEAVNLDHMDAVLCDFPKLRVILLNLPREGRSRFLYPLLKRHSQLYLCLSHCYSVHGGYEDLCRQFGHERWVCGTGYPYAEGGSAIAGLTYAQISDQAKEAIACGNIQRLLEEVQ